MKDVRIQCFKCIMEQSNWLVVEGVSSASYQVSSFSPFSLISTLLGQVSGCSLKYKVGALLFISINQYVNIPNGVVLLYLNIQQLSYVVSNKCVVT